MRKLVPKHLLYGTMAVVVAGVISFSFIISDNNPAEKSTVPVYGHWKNFTMKDGLPSDKAYCVRIDGERVLGWNP
jgi:hypothetical protein